MLVFGLGTSGGGAGAARFLAELGFSVRVTDQKNRRELTGSLRGLKELNISYALGGHSKKDFDWADVVVKNPSIPNGSPWIKYAQKHRKIITSDADIFLALAPRERLLGVTGTKGKTTTTRLLAHVLGKSAIAVGTPGVSFFEAFGRKIQPRWIVAEFSSFDLERVTESPHIAVVTSLFADHLNRYSNFRAYANAKMNLVRFQKNTDKAFVANTVNAQKYVPQKCTVVKTNVGTDERGVSYASIGLARAVAARLGVNSRIFTKRLKTFSLQPGSMEIVRKAGTRIFVNSTTATNPGAAEYVLRALAKRHGTMSVIAGGEDKKFPKSDIVRFARALKKYAKGSVVLLPGSFTERLAPHLGVGALRARSMSDAVRKANAYGKPVVLAPAATSFNMFKNEFDRGEQFSKAVRAL